MFQVRDSGREKYEKLKVDSISLSVVSYERIGGRIQTGIILDFRPAMMGFHATDIPVKI